MTRPGWPPCLLLALAGAFVGGYVGTLIAICSYESAPPDPWDFVQILVVGGLPGIVVGGLPALAVAAL